MPCSGAPLFFLDRETRSKFEQDINLSGQASDVHARRLDKKRNRIIELDLDME